MKRKALLTREDLEKCEVRGEGMSFGRKVIRDALFSVVWKQTRVRDLDAAREVAEKVAVYLQPWEEESPKEYRERLVSLGLAGAEPVPVSRLILDCPPAKGGHVAEGLVSLKDAREDLLSLVREWNGISVYPGSDDPNQKRLAEACIALVETGELASRSDGEALLVWVPGKPPPI